jgi:ABC-type transport system involved in cytochrome bd biosynthesis fused ATPase/permease subunit
LDVLTAQRIIHLLLNCAGQKGVLLITHWLPGLEEMDEIIVLEAGRTIQRGTHAQLVSTSGWYKTMWELQRGNLDWLAGEQNQAAGRL